MAFNLKCKCGALNKLYISKVSWVASDEPDESFTFSCRRCWKVMRATISKIEEIESPADKLRKLALGEIGKPYKLGVQYLLGTPLSKMKYHDCSELVRHLMYWAYDKIVPDGSFNQYPATIPITREQLETGDVGFLKNKKGIIHHVAIAISGNYVVEARGVKWGVIKTRIVDFSKRGGIWRRWK